VLTYGEERVKRKNNNSSSSSSSRQEQHKGMVTEVGKLDVPLIQLKHSPILQSGLADVNKLHLNKPLKSDTTQST